MSKRPDSLKLILCADDFAISPAVSEAICTLLDRRRISATSCMTVSKFWNSLSSETIKYRITADIGLHFTLTDFTALSDNTSFTEGHRFPSMASLLSKCLRWKIDLIEIREEFISQLKAFERAVGCPPDFVDGHHHVHQFPGIRSVITTELASRYGPSGPYLRNCTQSLSNIFGRGSAPARSYFVSIFGARLKKAADASQIRTNVDFCGFYDYSYPTSYASVFKNFMRSIRSGCLIMCHPGIVDGALRAADSLCEQRELEYQI